MPRLALAVVTADCVPVLLADARAGVVAAAHAGRVGAQRGWWRARWRPWSSAGAHAEDVSVLLGPAVSGRQLRGARGDGRRGRGGAARQPHDHLAGAPPGWTCGPESPGSSGIWASPRSTSTRAAPSPTRRCSVIAGTRRPGGWHRWCGWNDRMRWQLAGPRRSNWRTRWPPCVSALRVPRKRSDATSAEIELLPVTKFFPATDVAILLGLGCRTFGESREQEAKRRKRRRQLTRDGRFGGSALAHGRSDSAQQGAIDRALGARGALGRQRAAGRPRWTARRARLAPTGVRRDPLRVYVQVSLDGDVSRGGVDVETPDARRRTVRAGAGRAGLSSSG